MNGCRKFSQGNYSWMSVKNILGMNSTESELVEVRGWTRTSRSHKAVSFVSLSDGSSLANVQLVGSADVLPPYVVY
jgi:aspartyl/asparaginyl-tRNA synthetase